MKLTTVSSSHPPPVIKLDSLPGDESREDELRTYMSVSRIEHEGCNTSLVADHDSLFTLTKPALKHVNVLVSVNCSNSHQILQYKSLVPKAPLALSSRALAPCKQLSLTQCSHSLKQTPLTRTRSYQSQHASPATQSAICLSAAVEASWAICTVPYSLPLCFRRG